MPWVAFDGGLCLFINVLTLARWLAAFIPQAPTHWQPLLKKE